MRKRRVVAGILCMTPLESFETRMGFTLQQTGLDLSIANKCWHEDGLLREMGADGQS
jgi:hypothetical protein